MSHWQSITLDSPDWSPDSLLRPGPLELHPPSYLGQTVGVGEIAERLNPIVQPGRGDLLVGPADVDAHTGMVAPRRRDLSGRVHKGLLPGDVLVPTRPGSPAVLIDESTRGFAFSGGFLALRVIQELVEPTLLWAVLSSSSGRDARQAAFRSTVAPHLDVIPILSARIPIDPAWWERVRLHVRRIAQQPRGRARTTPVSHWSLMSLPGSGGRWDRALRGDVDEVEGSAALGELCTSIESGELPVGRLIADEASNLVPVVTSSALRRGTYPDRWALSADVNRPAQVGDALLCQTRRFLSAPVTEAMAVAKGVAILRFSDPELSRDFCAFANSDSGQRHLESFATGTTVPHLNVTTLRGMPVPEPWTLASIGRTADAHVKGEDLAVLLEEALWA